jgi:hypothetical protein
MNALGTGAVLEAGGLSPDFTGHEQNKNILLAGHALNQYRYRS